MVSVQLLLLGFWFVRRLTRVSPLAPLRRLGFPSIFVGLKGFVEAFYFITGHPLPCIFVAAGFYAT
jgi:branched-subunit amino acid transport protein